MRGQYETPELDVIVLGAEDVIVTSGGRTELPVDTSLFGADE